MKTIHLAGLGVAGLGMARCLGSDYTLQGHDESHWAELLAQDSGIAIGPNIEEMWHSDMIIPTPDPLVHKFAGGGKMEGENSDLCFLPNLRQIELCQDKAKSAEMLGELAPKTLWVRQTHGSGGAGAQMISEYLPGRNVSVEFVYRNNADIGYFMKERISYSLLKKTKGIDERGSSVVSVCIRDDLILSQACRALLRLQVVSDSHLNGFYGVDLKQAEDGTFKVTEINVGRLLTASYVYFYKTGYNLALAGVKAFLNEPYELGEYPVGYGILRTMDRQPLLVGPELTQEWR